MHRRLGWGNARRVLWTEPLVICGFGEMGSAVARFALGSGRHPHQIVVVEQEETRARLARTLGHRVVVSDATAERTLRSAGVARAATVVICLGDEMSVQAVQAARALAPGAAIRVVIDDSAAEREAADAGADMVLSLSRMAGRALAASVLSHTAENGPRQAG